MAEELGDLCKRISLTEGERDGIQVEELDVSEARVIAGKCLIGKIWTDKNVNQEAFISVFSNIWRIVGTVKFKELKDNIWLFEFSDDGDKRRVLDGRPWMFDRHIMVLNEFDGSIPPSQLEFRYSPFWVQVHEMPLLCMNKNVGTKIGNSLGILEDIDVAGNGLGWGSYLRLRVTLDIMKPLDRGRALNFGGKSSWIEFKYEKLPLFCFRCGRLVHGSKGCPAPPATHIHDREETKPWGSWLRAIDPRRKGATAGTGFRDGGATSNHSSGGEEADGARSEERFTGKASSGFFGNPTRRSAPVSPARRAESGSFLSGNSRCSDDIKGKGKQPSQIFLSKTGAHVEGESQWENCIMGQDMGRSGTAQLGLISCDENEDTLRGQEGVCEEVNMETIFMDNVEPYPDDKQADPIPPKLNIKKWKRRARNGNQSSVLSQASRKAKRERAETDVTQTTGMIGPEKRQKIVEATQGQSMEISAAAVEQPRREP
jgi:hypothetical protein